MHLKGKRLVVIGGTTGIGLSAAAAFVREGACVVVTGRDPDNGTKAASLLGPSASVIASDACQEGSAEEAVEACIARFGGFDGLYHVAGGSGRSFGDGPLHELTLEGWRKTLDMNLTSLMLSNRAAVRAFTERDHGGAILNMGSVLGMSPSPRHFTTHAYAAAKAAVIGLTRSTAAHYAAVGIRVNVLAPALVATPMSARAQGNAEIMDFIRTKQPLDGGRIGMPADLDGAAVYFLSDAARFTTGQVLYVDGGWDLSEGQYHE
jgi:NAD(P)-dependent dehydrogenase (short-subunit alcohol dehydrogenase family)